MGFLLLLVFVLSPVLTGSVSAETTSGTESDEDLEIEEELDSFRYSDGEIVYTETQDEETVSSESSLASTTTTTTYPTWTKSNSYTSYKLVTETTTDDETTTTTKKVSVSDTVRVGIDVSKWQGDIDWEKVAAAGVSFAIIRCCHGVDNDDAYFIANVEGAVEAGIDIGV